MSKKSKSAAKEKRRKKKKAEKLSKSALYAGYAAAGNNTKSKRFQRNQRASKNKVAVRTHSTNCGNVGCQRCHPINFAPFLVKGQIAPGTPHWVWKKWVAKTMEGVFLAS